MSGRGRKQQQQQQQQQGYYPSLYYSVDVECVATGTDHNARAVAQIALVDQYEQVILNVYVKPDKPVVSYLSALTGLTKELIDQHGVPLADGIKQLKAALPKTAILVGQSINRDVQWLNLRDGVDFASMMDLQGLWRVWNEQYRNFSMFSQDHAAKALLGWEVESSQHNAVLDAVKSMRLFNYHQQLQTQPEEFKKAQQLLLSSAATPSFAKLHPQYEGVCMGNRKTCTCGAPFLSA